MLQIQVIKIKTSAIRIKTKDLKGTPNVKSKEAVAKYTKLASNFIKAKYPSTKTITEDLLMRTSALDVKYDYFASDDEVIVKVGDLKHSEVNLTIC